MILARAGRGRSTKSATARDGGWKIETGKPVRVSDFLEFRVSKFRVLSLSSEIEERFLAPTRSQERTRKKKVGLLRSE